MDRGNRTLSPGRGFSPQSSLRSTSPRNGDIIFRDWITKKPKWSMWKKKWKRRYLIVTKTEIEMYTDDECTKLKFAIALNNIVNVHKADKGHNPQVLTIVTSKKTMEIKPLDMRKRDRLFELLCPSGIKFTDRHEIIDLHPKKKKVEGTVSIDEFLSKYQNEFGNDGSRKPVAT